MTVLERLRPSAENVRRLPARPRRSSRETAIRAYCALIAVGFFPIVGIDGSPPWRATRLLLTVAACIVVVRATAGSSRGGAAFAVALGTVSTTVGFTIGYSYLARTGVSAKALGAVLAALGGIGVLLAGVSSLLGGRGWARLLSVPLALLVAYAVVMPLATAVYATNVPRPELGAATPADRGLHYEHASFVTADRVRLAGWYVPSSNRAAVVLLHGASSTRANVLNQAVVLSRLGYGVLLFDARGHGESEGRAMEFGWYGDQDVAAAVSYVQGRADVDPWRIGAVGMSMGGEQALGAMAADDRLRAVVAEGATNRVFEDKHWLATEYGVRGRIQQGVEWLTYGLTDLLTAARPPISLREAASVARPVLLIAAGKVAQERQSNEAVQAVSPGTVELWVVPGAGHTGGLRTQPEEWERRVSTFFERALLQ